MEIATASRWMAAGHACSRRPVRQRASGGAVDHVIGGHDRLYPRYSLQPQELSAGQAAAGRSGRKLGPSAGAIAVFRGRMDTGGSGGGGGGEGGGRKVYSRWGAVASKKTQNKI